MYMCVCVCVCLYNIGRVIEGRSSIICFTVYYVDSCLQCGMDNVVFKLSLDTPQRKKGRNNLIDFRIITHATCKGE